MAFEDFVRVQSDAALRQVAGQYAYDDNEHDTNELTLRGGGEEINDQLERQLNERRAMAVWNSRARSIIWLMPRDCSGDASSSAGKC